MGFKAYSQADCQKDNTSPLCIIKSISIVGIDSLQGKYVEFPQIAYDKCSEVRIVDYYLPKEEKLIQTGHFFTCGEHEVETFVIDSRGNYSVCTFKVSIVCPEEKLLARKN
jgi:hypothetical protein